MVIKMTLTGCSGIIVDALQNKLGCPVIPSQNVKRVMQYPYCYYDVYSPVRNDKDGLKTVYRDKLTREEPTEAFMNLTFCGKNRMKDGRCVFGDREVQELVEEAHGFFLLDGHSFETPDGSDIVIRSVDEASKQDNFQADEFIRMGRLTIRFAYIRTDSMPSSTIESVSFKGTARTEKDAQAAAEVIGNNIVNDLLRGFESGLK